MNPKIQQALDLLTGCSASDFAELAILAADQAGMSADDQSDLRATLIPPCVECLQPTDGYSDDLCECCHDELERGRRMTERERRDADYYASGENWRGE
jgi:hypothetical protein